MTINHRIRKSSRNVGPMSS